MTKKIAVSLFILVTWLSASAFQAMPQNASFDGNYSSLASSVSSVTAAPAPFSKLLPVNGDPTQQTSGVILTWGATGSSTTTYQYCLWPRQKKTCPTSKWVNVGNSTSATLDSLTTNTTYYWQVRARDNGGTYTYANGGAWWSFHTMFGAPSSFYKASPANGATNQPLSLTLSWGASSGVNVHYEYCYSKVSFTTTCGGTWNVTSATSAAISGLSYNTPFYWQVRAVNVSGFTLADSGSVWHFTTISAPPSAFVKMSPQPGSSDEPLSLTFQWSPSTGATQYKFCIDASNNSTCDSGWILVSGTTTTQTLPNYNTPYYWQVSADNTQGSILADSGSWWTVTTMSGLPTDFNKINPTNGAADQSLTPTLYWWSQPSSGTTYSYCVSLTESCSTDWTPITKNTAIQVPASLDLQNDTPYYWQVRADNSDGTTYADSATWWSFRTLKAAPSWTLKTFSTPENQTLSAQLNAITNYPTTTGFELVGALPAGTLGFSNNGSFTYTPDPYFEGQVSFQFTVSDGHNLPAGPYTATITVTHVNDAPVLDAVPDQAVSAGDLVYFLATATDTDIPYGDTLTYSLVSPSPDGALINAANGMFVWATADNLTPSVYTITLKVTDSGGLSSTTTVRIVVNPGIPVTGNPMIYLPFIQG